jgi:uncharacterized membrane protein HdeD (DUF308 family)
MSVLVYSGVDRFLFLLLALEKENKSLLLEPNLKKIIHDGAVALVMALLRWPSSSLWAIGTVVGVSVLMGGITRIMIAAKIRSDIGRVEPVTRRAA